VFHTKPKEKKLVSTNAHISMEKVGAIFFRTYPPTFNAKSRRPNTKNCSNSMHGDLGVVQSNFFALNILFLGVESRRLKTKKIALATL
jgi:hypothetical protein